LPDGWQAELMGISGYAGRLRIFDRPSVTTREVYSGQTVAITVNGLDLLQICPWIFDLYEGEFRRLASEHAGVEAVVATDPLYAVNLNIQVGTIMHYECHVDSNPIQAVLGVSEFASEAGGESVFGASSIEDALTEGSYSRPIAGHIVYFDARDVPHFVKPLQAPDSLRVVAAFNYYTSDDSESGRPPDLSEHLYGPEGTVRAMSPIGRSSGITKLSRPGR
jgi:hypothetical protein